MSKSFNRVAALILVPCLVGDPLTASAFSLQLTNAYSQNVSAQNLQNAFIFKEQALIAGLVQAYTTVPVVASAIRKMEGMSLPNSAIESSQNLTPVYAMGMGSEGIKYIVISSVIGLGYLAITKWVWPWIQNQRDKKDPMHWRQALKFQLGPTKPMPEWGTVQLKERNVPIEAATAQRLTTINPASDTEALYSHLETLEATLNVDSNQAVARLLILYLRALLEQLDGANLNTTNDDLNSVSNALKALPADWLNRLMLKHLSRGHLGSVDNIYQLKVGEHENEQIQIQISGEDLVLITGAHRVQFSRQNDDQAYPILNQLREAIRLSSDQTIFFIPHRHLNPDHHTRIDNIFTPNPHESDASYRAGVLALLAEFKEQLQRYKDDLRQIRELYKQQGVMPIAHEESMDRSPEVSPDTVQILMRIFQQHHFPNPEETAHDSLLLTLGPALYFKLAEFPPAELIPIDDEVTKQKYFAASRAMHQATTTALDELYGECTSFSEKVAYNDLVERIKFLFRSLEQADAAELQTWVGRFPSVEPRKVRAVFEPIARVVQVNQEREDKISVNLSAQTRRLILILGGKHAEGLKRRLPERVTILSAKTENATGTSGTMIRQKTRKWAHQYGIANEYALGWIAAVQEFFWFLHPRLFANDPDHNPKNVWIGMAVLSTAIGWTLLPFIQGPAEMSATLALWILAKAVLANILTHGIWNNLQTNLQRHKPVYLKFFQAA